MKKLRLYFISVSRRSIEPIQDATESSEPAAKKAKFSLYNFLKEQKKALQADNDPNQKQRIQLSKELDEYLREEIIESGELDWWKDNSKRYPNLCKLAFKYLCIPDSSTPAERVFSKAGEIMSKKRSRIKSDHLGHLIFLNKNFDQL